jgi:hypothetical protein
MSGWVQAPRVIDRLPRGPAIAGLALVELEPGWYTLEQGTSGDAVFAESAPGSGVYEITTVPGAARVARAIALGTSQYGVLA